MISAGDDLQLDHCHHCGVLEPVMKLDSTFMTNNHRHDALREWSIHHCASCGGAVLTGVIAGTGVISEIYPSTLRSGSLPENLTVLKVNARQAAQADAMGV